MNSSGSTVRNGRSRDFRKGVGGCQFKIGDELLTLGRWGVFVGVVRGGGYHGYLLPVACCARMCHIPRGGI